MKLLRISLVVVGIGVLLANLSAFTQISLLLAGRSVHAPWQVLLLGFGALALSFVCCFLAIRVPVAGLLMVAGSAGLTAAYFYLPNGLGNAGAMELLPLAFSVAVVGFLLFLVSRRLQLRDVMTPDRGV